jgi:hypothetical protein
MHGNGYVEDCRWFDDRIEGPLAAVRLTAYVQVFRRRDDNAIDALGRPASEKRQGRKSRWVG